MAIRIFEAIDPKSAVSKDLETIMKLFKNFSRSGDVVLNVTYAEQMLWYLHDLSFPFIILSFKRSILYKVIILI